MTSILVVEDEPGISSFVAKGLTSAGYNVTVVDKGADAIIPYSSSISAFPIWTVSKY